MHRFWIAAVAFEEGGSHDQLPHELRVTDCHLKCDRAAIAKPKNIRLINVQIVQQRHGVVRRLHKIEWLLRNVGGVSETLLLKCNHLPIARQQRQQMTEGGFNRVAATMQEHEGRTGRIHRTMNFIIETETVNRGITSLHKKGGI